MRKEKRIVLHYTSDRNGCLESGGLCGVKISVLSSAWEETISRLSEYGISYYLSQIAWDAYCGRIRRHAHLGARTVRRGEVVA